MAENSVVNLTHEVKQASGEVVEQHRYRNLAKVHWEKLQGASDRAFSKDFEKGFSDGFTDYLMFGGGLVPSVPPRCYWASRYRTPEGYRAIEDWYGGFRLGVTTAQETGYRHWITMPSPAARAHADMTPSSAPDDLTRRSTSDGPPYAIRATEIRPYVTPVTTTFSGNAASLPPVKAVQRDAIPGAPVGAIPSGHAARPIIEADTPARESQLGFVEINEEPAPTQPMLLPPLDVGTQTGKEQSRPRVPPCGVVTFGSPFCTPLHPVLSPGQDTINRNEDIVSLPPETSGTQKVTSDR